MAIDFGPFKKLTPERRIGELQKLIDTLKKEIEQKSKEIREAEHLLAVSDKEARVIEQVQIPVAKPREKLEEKATEPEKLAGERRELEQMLATAPPRSDEIFHKMAHQPVQELYSELRTIYDRQQQTGTESPRDREMLYAISRGLEEKRKEGYKAPDEKARHLQTAAEQMAEGMYQSGAGTYKRGGV